MLLLGADLAFFFAAIGLVGPLTLVPLFVSKLTDHPLAIGLLMAAFHLGWLPQMFLAGYLERSRRKRAWLLWGSLAERLPVLGFALCALLVPLAPAAWVLGAMYLLRFAQTAAAGPSATTWMDYVGGTVPARRRGRFMSVGTLVGNLLGVASAAAAAPLLDGLGFPYGFAVCFGLGFAILLVSYAPLFWVLDPPGPPPREPAPFRAQLGELAAILSADGPFRRFVAGLSLASLGTMAAGFLAVFGATRLGASDELAAWYTVAVLVGQVGGNLALGWLGDRRGFGAVAQAGAASGVALSLVALLARDPYWLLPGFFLLGFSQTGIMLARMTGPMDFAPDARRPTYISLSNALTSLAAAGGPLFGSWVVAALDYPALFGLSSILSFLAALALVPLARIRHPEPVATAPKR